MYCEVEAWNWIIQIRPVKFRSQICIVFPPSSLLLPAIAAKSILNIHADRRLLAFPLHFNTIYTPDAFYHLLLAVCLRALCDDIYGCHVCTDQKNTRYIKFSIPIYVSIEGPNQEHYAKNIALKCFTQTQR